MARRPNRRRWRLILVAVLAMTLTAGACGDRGGDESGSGGTVAAETSHDGQSAAGEGDFGDLPDVCGPAEGEVGPTGDDPAESLGVTDDAIRVGTVADPGFQGRPGLNQEIFDAGEAFVDWCNEAGGINGRPLALTLYDAAINNYQPEVEAACDNEFALVGSGAVQDNLWPEVGAACGLIDVAGFSVTPEKGGLAGRDPVEARTIQPLPNPADRQIVAAAALLADEFPEAVRSSYILFADLATLVTQADKEAQGFGQVGFDFIGESVYNVLGETNWAPFATDIAAAEPGLIRFVGEPANLALLQLALQEIGYQPEVTFQVTSFYDQTFLDAAGDAAEGTFVESIFSPFEEADENPATARFLEVMEAQGGKVALLGAQSMSGWLLFATAARDCDRAGDLSRTCVLETTAQAEEWTGGGLHAPTSPGTNEGATCQVLLRVEDGAFVRHAPDDGYACDESYQVEVEPGAS